jgi:hypothetical protein
VLQPLVGLGRDRHTRPVSTMKWGGAAAPMIAALILSGAGVGCRSVAAMRQRCLAGDLSACESACQKGVVGEGGCFHAAEQYRGRAALDFGGSDWRKSADLFRRSCDGGYADGCLFAAQAIEAPYTAEGVDGAEGAASVKKKMPTSAMALPSMISDSEVRTREQRLVKACSLGSAAGCKRLGDVLIGKASDRAQTAYVTACRAGSAPRDCEAARSHEVELGEGFRAGCTHRQADQCTLLGNLLFAVDPPRAMRLFASECELRGVADLSGGFGGFVRGREAEAAKGIVLPDGAPRAALPPGTLPVEAHATRVAGELALVEVDRALSVHRDELTACVAKVPASDELKLVIQLVVDRTGDVWRASIGEGRLPPSAANCVIAFLETLSLSEPRGGLATVEVRLLRAAASPPPAAPARP